MASEMAVYADEMTAEDQALARDARIQSLGQALSRKLDDQIRLKREIESRWIKDFRQYSGQYDADTLAKIKAAEGSEVFVNISRPKAHAAEARLSEMLLPTEDRNFGIQPTPVPELQEAARLDEPFTDAYGRGYPSPDHPDQPLTWKELAEQEMAKARERAKAMEREIDDQLTEADYHAKARDVIHDACVLGTGILKGPVVQGRMRKSWRRMDGAHVLEMVQEIVPGVERVSPWDFFPDMAAARIVDAEFTFERRFVSRRALRDLAAQAQQLGYLREQIKEVLAENPREYQRTTEHIAQLREISGLTGSGDDARYELWEYHGPVDREMLRACGCEVDDDPLMEFYATVEFIGDRVIRANQEVLESGESLYSVFCYEHDECSIFGYGVLYILANPQRVLNASFRMMLDNAALSVGPQIVMDRRLKPADGNRKITPKKLWIKDDPEMPITHAFAQFAIDSHQAELANIYQIARLLADEESSLPMLSQGERANAPDTASGMSMLLNAANTQLRRIVKRFDDDVTTPLISRFYDWNMAYSDKEEIKGDYQVDARGSSTLLVKETQQQGLMQMMQFAGHPVFGPITKVAEVYRRAWQSFHVTPDDVVMSDDEIQQMQARLAEQSAQQQGGDDARVVVEQMRMQDRERERAMKTGLAQMDAHVELTKLAASKDLTLEQMKAHLGEVAIKLRGQRQMIADEAQIKYRTGSGI